MTALSGAAHNFLSLFAARVGIGVGEAGCLPTSQSMICDFVPPAVRPKAFAINNLGNYAGITLGIALTGSLAALVGWRLAFVIIGLPGFVLALAIWLLIPEPTRGNFDDANEPAAAPLIDTIVVLWRCKPYRYLTVFYALTGFVSMGLNQWWPSYFTRIFHLTPKALGLYLGAAIGAGSATGSLLGGFFAEKLQSRQGKLPLLVGAMATLGALPTALGALATDSAFVSLSLIAATGFFLSVSNGPVIATAYTVVPAGMRATAGSINVFSASVIGFGGGPLCVGIVSDWLAPSYGADSLRYALISPMLAIPFIALLICLAARALPPSPCRPKLP